VHSHCQRHPPRHAQSPSHLNGLKPCSRPSCPCSSRRPTVKQQSKASSLDSFPSNATSATVCQPLIISIDSNSVMLRTILSRIAITAGLTTLTSQSPTQPCSTRPCFDRLNHHHRRRRRHHHLPPRHRRLATGHHHALAATSTATARRHHTLQNNAASSTRMMDVMMLTAR
jgi:hypothetical protein